MLRFFLILSTTFLAMSCAVSETVSNGRYKAPTRFYEDERAYLEQKGRDFVKAAYAKEADIQNCVPGQITVTEKQKALDELNRIRKVHHLDEVSYNEGNDKYTSASALINTAEQRLDHYPKKSAKCYSANGAVGSKESNLHISTSSSVISATPDYAEEMIDSLLIDSNVESLGHRAWFLNPFLKSISYGRASNIIGKTYVDSAAVMINDEKESLAPNSPDYVAYPYENYVAHWFEHGWYASFSVIANKNDRWKNKNVNFSNAKIKVTDESGNSVTITDIGFTTSSERGYAGLPNRLKWKMKGTKNNTKYLVKISDVLVNGKQENYEYWFNIR